MTENTQYKKVPSLSEIQAQLKAKKVEVLTPENTGELKNIFILAICALLAVFYIYNNPFNFTSLIGVIKFIQLLVIGFIGYCIYSIFYYINKYKGQSEKIGKIYESKTVVKK
jgi:hypothetical protein